MRRYYGLTGLRLTFTIVVLAGLDFLSLSSVGNMMELRWWQMSESLLGLQ